MDVILTRRLENRTIHLALTSSVIDTWEVATNWVAPSIENTKRPQADTAGEFAFNQRVYNYGKGHALECVIVVVYSGAIIQLTAPKACIASIFDRAEDHWQAAKRVTNTISGAKMTKVAQRAS
jgi:hypothetical protein